MEDVTNIWLMHRDEGKVLNPLPDEAKALMATGKWVACLDPRSNTTKNTVDYADSEEVINNVSQTDSELSDNKAKEPSMGSGRKRTTA